MDEEKQEENVVETFEKDVLKLKDFKCFVCGGTEKLWIQANGITRCKKHYVLRDEDDGRTGK